MSRRSTSDSEDISAARRARLCKKPKLFRSKRDKNGSARCVGFTKGMKGRTLC